MTKELNDPLHDLLSGPIGEVREASRAPADYKPNFDQVCSKCGGTGRYRHFGQCFACKGKGKKSFKQSPEVRAAKRERRAERKTRRIEDIAAHNVETFSGAEPEAWAWITRNVDRGNAFATNLANGVRKFGALTQPQSNAVYAAIARDQEHAKERADREANAPDVVSTRLEQAFATARKNAERPGQMGVMIKPIKMQSGDTVVKVLPGRPGGKWADTLFVRNGDDKKLGQIRNGKFVRHYLCEDAEEAAVLSCVNDPERAVTAYGKAWSRCGICGRGLLRDESIARAMGPICAERFGWM